MPLESSGFEALVCLCACVFVFKRQHVTQGFVPRLGDVLPAGEQRAPSAMSQPWGVSCHPRINEVLISPLSLVTLGNFRRQLNTPSLGHLACISEPTSATLNLQPPLLPPRTPVPPAVPRLSKRHDHPAAAPSRLVVHMSIPSFPHALHPVASPMNSSLYPFFLTGAMPSCPWHP